MKMLKRAAAALLSVCTVLGCTSCGENTAYVLDADDYAVRAGIYLYFVNSAYSDAMDVVNKEDESLADAKTTAEVKKVMKNAVIDSISAETWIQNKAEEYCANFVAVEKEFDRLGLKLTGSDLAGIDQQLETNMAFYGNFYEQTGIGEQSVKDIIANSYKQDAVWQAYYGEGGSIGVEADELYDYYADNNFRVKYISMPLKDGEGNLLKSDGKAEIEKMAKDYLARLEKKADDEAALMKEFDFLIDEHNHYVTSLSEAAVTTTDDEGNTITTPTTAKVTTDKDGNTDTTTADATTTTKAGDASGAETTTTTDGTGDAAETTTTTDVTTESTTTTTTTTAEGDVATDTTGGDTDTTTTSTTTTTASTTYDKSYERTVPRITSATVDPKEPDATTTEPNYTPCEKVYNWLADDSTKYLKPELIKDDECYYIAVKLDIRDRMVRSDLWTESAEENVRQTLYFDDYKDLMQGISDKLTIGRNERAFKRYKVLDVDVMLYQSCMMNYYYNLYGLYNS